MQRGRPRHDDILTPREWEVLALIREGLTNEEIAERLNISFSTARFHVSEIIGKLGVANRHEAASWAEGRGRSRRFIALPSPGGLNSPKRAWSVPSRIAAVVIGVGFLALLLLALNLAFDAWSSAEELAGPSAPTIVEPVGETTVIVYRPASLPSDREQGEYCIASGLLPREGAWACWGGRSPGLTEPCFGDPGDLEVVCPSRPEPGFPGAYVLELDEPPVAATPTSRPGAPTPVPPDPDALARRAWWVETADGRLCGFKTGGTAPVVNGERINFWCPDDANGLLGLPTPGKVWTARQVPLEVVPAGTVVPETIVELRTVWR